MAKFTLKEYLMGRENTHRAEYTDEIEEAAQALLIEVNGLFEDLGYTKPASLSSGWRPASVNKAVGGAPSSYHVKGMAIDIKDPDGSLYKLVTSKPELMRKRRLWAEHRDSSPTWLHLDMGTRQDRPSRVFKP